MQQIIAKGGKITDGGKTYRLKEICKTSASQNIHTMCEVQVQQTKEKKKFIFRTVEERRTVFGF